MVIQHRPEREGLQEVLQEWQWPTYGPNSGSIWIWRGFHSSDMWGGGGREGLGATGILTQEENPGGTTLVDAGNGFNNLIRLAMIWTVRHRWSMG